MAKTATRPVEHAPHLYESWPHPRPPLDDPVDERLVAVIRRALRSAPSCEDQRAAYVAERVWAWLAEGDA